MPSGGILRRRCLFTQVWKQIVEDGRPSETAIQVASLRAAHLIWDDEPKILRDDFAMALAGFDSEASLRSGIAQFRARLATAMGDELATFFVDHLRALLCLRARYAEDELANAVKEKSVSQFVVLGAGLDSVAYRRQDLTKGLRVFEMDHPASQTWKQKRLREMGVAVPPNLTFLPIDFERQSLDEGLRPSTFRWDVPTFFSWLGVTMYLEQASVISTLRTIARMPTGSEVVFDYNDPPTSLSADLQKADRALGTVVAQQREPFRSFFEPNDLVARLHDLGFSSVRDLELEEANRRYFVTRTDALALPPSAPIPILTACV